MRAGQYSRRVLWQNREKINIQCCACYASLKKKHTLKTVGIGDGGDNDRVAGFRPRPRVGARRKPIKKTFAVKYVCNTENERFFLGNEF